jgi:hypothetical protein
MSPKIIENKVKCNACGEVLVSNNPNKSVTCSCGSTTINGGLYELIREGADYTEMTKYFLNE